ncbi:ROK family transcriptional regulator [Yinghuangia soli]|uniref:ROK family protein n=1 Tax=Yinghuangia soli TaxID=2908204 RepID=A0AA41Q3V1_9ACTN|nr:ROK family transcriptional regulator [Yinghuangia soli]MCF2531053.1 ROK family protein [Yinghuangia soli]
MRAATRPENGHQSRLLGLLRDGGPRSRAELGDLVHMSRSKVAVELDRLTELGLIRNAGLAASRGGRRSGIVCLDPSLRFVGIDIGATSVGVAVTDGELQVLGRLLEPCDVRRGPEAVLGLALSLVAKMRDQGLLPEVHGVGLGIPGPVSFREGVPVVPPIMPGWDRYPVRETLGHELGCPVQVDNDVNIMAVGERHAGSARSVDDFLFVKIGTGIGCGIVVNGGVYRGASGSAGDIGHIRVAADGPTCACGNTGCLEAFFGGAALTRDATAAAESGASPHLAARLAESGEVRVEDVAQAMMAGDATAMRLVRAGGRRVGQVLASLVSFFNPGLIVLGGSVPGLLGHPLLAEIRSVVYRQSLPLATGNLPIVLSELRDTAGIIGATRVISDHVFSAP